MAGPALLFLAFLLVPVVINSVTPLVSYGGSSLIAMMAAMPRCLMVIVPSHRSLFAERQRTAEPILLAHGA